jgi:ABC-type sugar transport system substrate-binding protein
MKRLKGLLILGLVLIVALVAGCGTTTTPAPTSSSAPSTSASASPTAKEITVGLVQIDLSNPFHLGEVQGAQEAARRYGFRLVVASGEGDVNKQIQAVENLINQHVDVLAINFIDINAFGPTLQKAKAAGIPVVGLHSFSPDCTMMLGFDELHTGRIDGEYAVKLLTERYGSPKGEVANLQGLLGQGLNEQRTGGFLEVISQYPDIKVDAKEPTNWDPNKAATITENWITAYPNLDLIYGNSDSLTVPAANVLQRAGKLNTGNPKDPGVMIVSVDGTDSGLKAVKDGLLKSTVLLAPQYTGYWKAWIPYRLAKGENLGKEVLIEGTLITKDNVDIAIQIAKDQVDKIQTFPFEKPLPEIFDQYAKGQSTP